MYHYKHNTFDQ